MGQVSSKFRRYGGGLAHWCNGCKSLHMMRVDGEQHPKWTFNGDFEKATFTPSYVSFSPEHTDEWVHYPRETLCHVFVKDGQIQYLDDCPHELRGQTVEIPDLPEYYRDWEQPVELPSV